MAHTIYSDIRLSNAEYEYRILSDGTVELLSYIGSERERIQIPHVIDGRAVTVIGTALFAWRNIKEVLIPATVHTIKGSAFYSCENLSSIGFAMLSDNLRNVGRQAFENTAYFNDTNNWDDGILYINHKRCIVAAKGNFFKKYHGRDKSKVLKIPSEVTCIASGAFCHAKGFATVYGQHVAVNSYSFYQTDVKCPIFVDCDIHSTAFKETPFMSKVENWNDSCIYTQGILLSCKANDGTQCKIAQGTVAIADGAFDECGENVTVTVPLSVERIGVSNYPDSLVFYCEH